MMQTKPVLSTWFLFIFYRIRSFSNSSFEYPHVESFNEDTFTQQSCTTHHHTHLRKLFGPAYTSYFRHFTQSNVNITCTYTRPSGRPVKLDNTLAHSAWLFNNLQTPLQTRIILLYHKWNKCDHFSGCKVWFKCLALLIFLKFYAEKKWIQVFLVV